jgi:hypothetical protein
MNSIARALFHAAVARQHRAAWLKYITGKRP